MIRQIVLLFLISLTFMSPGALTINAQDVSKDTQVKAQVGEFSLSISGFSSANASITLRDKNLLLSSTIADNEGNFSFEKIPINRGFSSFCIRSVDQMRLGESEGCMYFEPANDNLVFSKVYLPPTIGLENNAISFGSSGLTYGYTMPEADVEIDMASGESFTTRSDESGRYGYTLGNLAVGTYDLSSTGEYQGIESLTPSSKVQLRVLTSSASFTDEAALLRKELLRLIPLLLLFLVLLLLIAFYFIRRFKPQWLQPLIESELFTFIKRKKGLHHDWFERL